VIARLLARAENAGLVAALAVMALLPLAEIALRAAFQVGVSGAAAFTQNLALVAGMFGAVVAAREGRLLSLSSLPSFLAPSAATLARQFTGVVSAAIAALLCVASVEFVCAERSGGNVIAYGVPIWLMAAALPAGFALMTLRLAGAAPSRPGRVAALSVALAIGLAAANGFALSGTLVWALLGLLLLAALLGSPVFATLGGAALILFWGDGLPIASMTLDHYRLVVNPSLPMIPLFTLAGYFLAEGGAPRRLVRVCDALFGGLRGGAALVAVIACVFFTSFSGASGVTIIALGGMLMPLLLGSGYAPKTALGLLTSAGSLGGLLPPGLPLVLYAIVAKVSINDMFVAGILPGLLMIGLVAAWGMRQAPPQAARRRFDAREARAALWDAKWELALPIVAFAALFSGRATPVEAAALTAVYALFVEVFVYRDLDLRRDVPRVMVQAGLLVGGILLILGVALGLTNYLVDAQIPERAVEWVTGTVKSRWLFLLLLNLFLLVAGCFLDIFSATVVLVPILLPLASAYGIDPVHLGIIFLANMELGYLTPPVGMNLFFAAYRFGKPLPEVFRAVLPPLCVLAGGVLLITFLPWLTTAMLKGGSL
jgi:tripartite ATP-independent transporter DctM subunit